MINRIFTLSITILLIIVCTACKSQKVVPEKEATVTQDIPNINETFLPQYIHKASSKITLDGSGTELEWEKANWRAMDQLMLGDMPSKEDFQGKYKLLWDEDMIYILAEIQDDNFMDTHLDGLDKYWDDDCLEIFIDEDRSRGDHQYSYNAFAYHVSLDNKVVDLGDNKKPQYYNDHIQISKDRKKNKIVWELGLSVYTDKYNAQNKANPKATLVRGKKIGFMLAYCDNDQSEEREHFMGDMFIPGEDKNKGWIDAGVFGQINLK